MVKDLESALGVTDLLDEPSLEITLLTEYDFLTQDSLAIVMSPQIDLEAAVYTDISLVITIYEQQDTIPVEVTVTACTPDIKFKPAKLTEEYVIGSGSRSITFPTPT